MAARALPTHPCPVYGGLLSNLDVGYGLLHWGSFRRSEQLRAKTSRMRVAEVEISAAKTPNVSMSLEIIPSHDVKHVTKSETTKRRTAETRPSLYFFDLACHSKSVSLIPAWPQNSRPQVGPT